MNRRSVLIRNATCGGAPPAHALGNNDEYIPEQSVMSMQGCRRRCNCSTATATATATTTAATSWLPTSHCPTGSWPRAATTPALCPPCAPVTENACALSWWRRSPEHRDDAVRGPQLVEELCQVLAETRFLLNARKSAVIDRRWMRVPDSASLAAGNQLQGKLVTIRS
jgi:hypothetical protein